MTLSAENLSCARAGITLLSGLGFSLSPGSLLIVRGKNGSGKTTLLNTIAGLIPPASGRVNYNGENVSGNAAYLRELAYIGHKNALKDACTVEESLRFFAASGEALMIPAAMRYFNLGPKADTPVGVLSAGWRRRVALTRLLLTRAQVWLLDEPTNFLDEEAVLLFISLVESRVQQGGIVVIASHTVQSSFAAHTLELGDFAHSSLRGDVADVAVHTDDVDRHAVCDGSR